MQLASDGTVKAESSHQCDYEENWGMSFHNGDAMAESTQGREAALKLAREKLEEKKADNA